MNLVQWSSYVFAVLAVSLLALRLGASRRGQQVAALTAATIPMAMLQASTTQNDLNVGLWCLVAVYCALTFAASVGQRPAVRMDRRTGAALGSALVAKATAYMYCFPFFLWLAIAVVRRDGWKRAASLATGVLLTALVLNSAWYVGNAQLLGGMDVIGVRAPGVPPSGLPRA